MESSLPTLAGHVWGTGLCQQTENLVRMRGFRNPAILIIDNSRPLKSTPNQIPVLEHMATTPTVMASYVEATHKALHMQLRHP